MKIMIRKLYKQYKLKYVIIIVAALLVCIWSIERIIEWSAQKQLRAMSDMLGCEVYAEQVKYTLVTTNLQIGDFYIKNPAGYSTAHPMLHVKSIEIQVKPLAILKHLVHIEKLFIHGVTLNVEAKKSPDSIMKLIRFLRNPELNLLAIKPLSKGDISPQTPDSTAPAPKYEPWFIRIDDLAVSKVSVRSLNTTGYLAKINFSLPPYSERNLGQSGNMTPAQVALEALKRRAVETIARIKERVKSGIKDVLHID